MLARGYAIVLNERDGIVREAADAPVGENVKILLAKDALIATGHRMIPPAGTFIGPVRNGAIRIPPPMKRYCDAESWSRSASTSSIETI